MARLRGNMHGMCPDEHICGIGNPRWLFTNNQSRLHLSNLLVLAADRRAPILPYFKFENDNIKPSDSDPSSPYLL